MSNKAHTFSSLSQSGNVFVIILVAIALFGALMFTFARSGSQGVSSISKQEAKIAAQEILSYAQLVEGAVDRVRRNGCSESEISFENDVITGFNYTNPNTTTDACKIFNPSGGKISYSFNNNWLSEALATDYVYFAPRHCIDKVGTGNGSCSTSSQEIILLMGPLKQEICFSLNEMNNIPKVSNDVPSINSSGNPFIGTFATGGFFMIDGPFTGKSYGCHKDTLGGGTGYYWFHYAILAR